MTTIPRSSPSLALFFCLLLGMSCTSARAASCTVTSNTVNFGSYDVFSSSPLDSSGTLKIRCNPGNTPYTISLNNGLYGSITNRSMRNNSSNQSLSYNLYTDATYATIWGDGTGGGVTVSGSAPNDYTVYGRIPPLQDVGVGSYSDIITVTVNF